MSSTVGSKEIDESVEALDGIYLVSVNISSP